MSRTSNQTSEGPGGTFAPAGSGAWYCKRRQLVRELSSRAADRLRRRARTRKFQFRDLLFTSDATEGVLHIVLSGRVRLSRFDPDGGETQLAILEPGEAFREPLHGEVEALTLYAEGLAAGELLSIDLTALRELVGTDAQSYQTLGGALG